MNGAGSLAWFARHEVRLAWREALAMLRVSSGGRRRWGALIALLIFEVVVHAVAYEVIKPLADELLHPDTAMLLTATGVMVLTGTLFLSQAMETATRSFYSRGDLDLILSSPAPAHRLLAVRIAAIAATTIAMAALIAGPAIDALAAIGGARILVAYGVVAALATVAASGAVALTALLFRLVGAKRTRLVAQIVAAVVGAGVVIGVQAAAILGSNSMSRIAIFRSPTWVAAAPAPDSVVWWPVRAALGDLLPLAALLAGAAVLLAVTMHTTAGAFVANAEAVAGLGHRGAVTTRRRSGFRLRSPAAALRHKEWVLLRRDPWLVSQSLMQVLYLVPPALMLWHSYGSDIGGLVILVPVIVMAAGQLAGGLAWLAISGEDAPDLVATAPVPPAAILRAKIEAVGLAVALPLAPLLAALALASLFVAATAAAGSALAAAGASTVQYIFRVKGRRSNFRRRQTSSRIATFAEAFVSISVAAAAGLAAAGSWFATVPLVIAGTVLGAARAVAGPVP